MGDCPDSTEDKGQSTTGVFAAGVGASGDATREILPRTLSQLSISGILSSARMGFYGKRSVPEEGARSKKPHSSARSPLGFGAAAELTEDDKADDQVLSCVMVLQLLIVARR